MNKLKILLNQFVKDLFPSFEISKAYYYYAKLDSKDTTEQIISRLLYNPIETIKMFEYSKFVNNDNINELKILIKDKYLPNNSDFHTEILLNTFARKILSKIHAEEKELEEKNCDLQKILLNEIETIIKFLTEIPKEQEYLILTNDLIFDDTLFDNSINSNLTIKGKLSDYGFLLSFKIKSFEYREIQKYKKLLETAFLLIYGTKIEFYIFDDILSIYFKKYGCNEAQINSIRNYCMGCRDNNVLFKLGNKYNIDKTNICEIKDLFSLYINLLNKLDKNDYRIIALDFYNDAVKGDKHGASKITYLIIALEALFNTKEFEISRSLRQRCVKLLQYFYCGSNSMQIEKDLQTAYSIRSSYAHGSSRENKKAKWDIAERIQEYLKLSLLIFLQLDTNTKSKKDFNQLIDDSLLYINTNEQLNDLLKNIKIYSPETVKLKDMSILDYK